MLIDTEDSGFLSRWSRRKALVREGAAAAEPSPPTAVASAPGSPALRALPARPALPALPVPPAPAAASLQAAVSTAPASAPAAQPQPAAEPLPTLADVAALTRDSDYSRFMTSSVQPDVKNAALAKLFTDPHFNVMDGLDTYIDDYGKPDPLPPGMLRQMLQSQVLGLFDDEDQEDKPALVDTEAQLACEAAPPTEPAAHENTDLQLQPDDDAGPASAAKGADEDAGCAH